MSKTRQNIDGVIVIADNGRLSYVLPKTFDSLAFRLYKQNHELLLEKIRKESKKEKTIIVILFEFIKCFIILDVFYYQ